MIAKMQKKKQSLIEAITNSFIAFFLNIVINILVLPFFGIDITIHQNAGLSFVFVFLSIFRNYITRRIFNIYHK